MATRPAIDDLTAGAIRQALTSAAAGRLADAVSVGEHALAQGGDVAALNAMLGMLQGKVGNADRAIGHLRVAHEARPNDPIIANNLATSLSKADRQAEALEVLSDDLVEADPSRQLLKLRAFLAQMTDDFDLAIRSYENVVAAEPGDCEMWNNLGNAYQSAGQPEKAIPVLRRAAEIDPGSAPIRLNFANALLAAGEWDQSEDELRSIAKDFPEDPNPLRELHKMLRHQGRDQEALECIDQAIELDPQNLDLLLGRAGHLSGMLKANEAEAMYRRVLEIDADNSLAYLGIAVCMDVTNRSEDLSALVSEAEAKDVRPNALSFIRAFDHRRAKRFAEGLAALEEVPADLDSARRSHLLGQLLEGVDRYDEAFVAYTRMNELRSAEGLPPEPRAENYRKLIRERLEATKPEWVSRWRPQAEKDPRSAPVFLVGFPRSGTTLLDTMLMGHPNIEVLEEEPTLFEAFQVLEDHDTLPLATDEQIVAARNAYFEAAGALTPLKAGNLLVDKNPLAMNALPVIRRLFPDARIILALRHPCDVVLSCYVTNFKLNDGMSNFVHLETTAELYDLSFSYLERCQELMPMPMHRVIYENVVADRNRELRSLFEFLGLDWHDAVLDHQTTALGRGRIKTASYSQVVEPIYKRSAGRWQNYRKHLEPIIPVLRPWIDKFGYEV
jgi:tetratricopeptide (TPR) repeat protein